MPKQQRGKSKQNYQTPEIFLDAAFEQCQAYVQGILGWWAFDFASDDLNAVAAKHWTEQDDSLAQPAWAWAEATSGGWGWLNPPFKNIHRWVDKAWQAREQGGRLAMLIPASTGSNYWRDYIHKKAHVLLLNGRITFGGMPPNPKTGKIDPYPKDCVLLLYTADLTPGYDVWTWNA